MSLSRLELYFIKSALDWETMRFHAAGKRYYLCNPADIVVYLNIFFEKAGLTIMEIDIDTRSEPKYKVIHEHHESGAIYGLGFLGAAIYFIGTATTFWMGVLGFLKALVWPAFLVYEALKVLY